MKLLHISDLHVGLKLHDFDLTEDQQHVFNQIFAYAKSEEPQAILIAGDVYDKADPSTEAVAMFDRFVTDLHAAAPNAEIMIVSGNHDSRDRLNLYRNILRGNRVRAIGLPPQKDDEYIERVTLEDEFGPVDFYLLPFVKPTYIKNVVGQREDGTNYSYDEAVHKLFAREQIDQTRRNVLVSHQYYKPGADQDLDRSDSEITTVGNVDFVLGDVLAPFDYAALGHIHKPQCVGSDRYRYCGTPMQYSVSEAGQDKGAILVELGAKGDVKTTVLPLTPLRPIKKIKGELEDVLKQACDDCYVSVTLTDERDLDAADRNARLRNAFKYLLPVNHERSYQIPDGDLGPNGATLISNPCDLCLEFLNNDLDEDSKKLLQDVLNLIKEEN